MDYDQIELDVSVSFWRLETGEPEFLGVSRSYPTGYRVALRRGWYCHAYPTNNKAFEKWMDKICPSAEYQHRFNSGDPMYTVQIFDEREAFLFQIAWVK